MIFEKINQEWHNFFKYTICCQQLCTPSLMYSRTKSFKFFNVMTDLGYNNPIYNENKFKIAIKEHKLNSANIINNFVYLVNKV